MGIFNLFNKGNNYEKFLLDCQKVIVSYEKDTIPSCKDDLIDAIKIMTNGAKNEINKGLIPPSQYDALINKLLANCSFDLLTSGKYHIGRGMLNTMSCSSNLMSVHNGSIDYALKNNMITQSQKDEDHEYLMECINNVG